MKSVFSFFIFNLAVLGNPAWAEEVLRPGVQPVQASPASSSGPETIQSCLDNLRKSDWEFRQRTTGATQQTTATIQPYTFHRIDPSELPNTCVNGDLATFKQALTNQLVSCQRSSEPRAQDALKVMCDGKSAPTWCLDPIARKTMLDEERLALAEDYNGTTSIKFGCRTFTRKEWCGDTNLKMLQLTNQAKDFPSLMSSVKDQFDWVKSDGKIEDDKDGKFKKGDMQFTAYDAPSAIEASPKQTAQFKYPIYRKPPNLIQLAKDDPKSCGADELTGVKRGWCLKNTDGTYSAVPTRKEIDAQDALKNDSLIIGYVKDPVDMAFLMVQGSGSININTPEGKKTLRLNYDGQNGRTRFMLARIVKCDGGTHDDFGSEQGIRKYLMAHSDREEALLNFDQSYVFLHPDTKGPFGADGIPISARHSLATDPSVIPTGSVALFNMPRPPNSVDSCSDLTSMAISQDTGGAIHGAHVDWYTGDGAEAEALAGKTNAAGSLAIALPKGAGKPIEGCPAPAK